MQKNSFTYDELISCGKGELFGEGNAKLPLPPMLMFDRITKINNNLGKFLTGIVSGTLNSLTTLGGMPVALFLLVINIQPAIIRGSLAALFFLTDIYAFILSFFVGIVDLTTIYRTIPLIFILPIGVFIGNKFFVRSEEETYRKVVFYFLIIISVFGILRITNAV